MPRIEDETVGIAAAVVASSPSAIVAADLDGTIIAWNPAAEAMTGFSAADALGADILSTAPDGERQEAARLLSLVRGGETVSNRQVKRLRADGSTIIGSLTLAPIRDTNGEIVGTVGIMHDVTARIAMEQQLRRDQRLAAVGRLAADVAHEINNPVGGILMAAEYASAALDRDDARVVIEKALIDIQTDARRCGDIVRRLLRSAQEDHPGTE